MSGLFLTKTLPDEKKHWWIFHETSRLEDDRKWSAGVEIWYPWYVISPSGRGDKPISFSRPETESEFNGVWKKYEHKTVGDDNTCKFISSISF